MAIKHSILIDEMTTLIFLYISCSHQLDARDVSEAERLSQRARVILAQIHALIGQDYMHENLLHRPRDHHTRLVDPDPLVHIPTGVSLEESVQFAVVLAEQPVRAGSGHGNVTFNTSLTHSTSHILRMLSY